MLLTKNFGVTVQEAVVTGYWSKILSKLHINSSEEVLIIPILHSKTSSEDFIKVSTPFAQVKFLRFLTKFSF